MKKITIIVISILCLGVGCGTIKKAWSSVFPDKPHEELKPPPNPDEVEYDENGNPIFTDEQLSGNKKPFNWTSAFFIVSFLTASGFIVRHIVKKK
jgi:hypothetical protein